MAEKQLSEPEKKKRNILESVPTPVVKTQEYSRQKIDIVPSVGTMDYSRKKKEARKTI